MRLALLLVAASLAGSVPVRAALTWKDKTLNLKADANSTVLEGRYHFTNAGSSAVNIVQVESSCGCTTAELEKRQYAPGESGDIVARFTVGARVGRQIKTIAVRTNDQAEPTTLTLVAEIPEILRIRPSLVFWMEGEAKTPKSMTLELQGEPAIDKITVQTSNPAMTPVLTELTKGRRYELTVTPGNTDRVMFGLLTIECIFPGKVEKTFRAYATVKPPEQGGQ